MCMMYVSFESKIHPKHFHELPLVVFYYCFSSRLLLYSTGSGVNRVQVVCLDLV